MEAEEEGMLDLSDVCVQRATGRHAAMVKACRQEHAAHARFATRMLCYVRHSCMLAIASEGMYQVVRTLHMRHLTRPAGLASHA